MIRFSPRLVDAFRVLGTMALAVGVLAVSSSGQAASKHDAYSLTLDVGFRETDGPESIRDRLRDGVLQRLEFDGCFDSVVPHVPGDSVPSDLLLVVDIDTYDDETSYMISMAQRDDPNAVPGAERLVVATFRLSMFVDLVVLPEEVSARSKKQHVSETWRPRLDEDPRLQARELGLERAARAVATWACKGVKGKGRKQIERARSAAAAPR